LTVSAGGRGSGPAGTNETLPVDERRRLVRRNTVLLATAQGLATMTFPVLLIVGSVAAVDISGRDSAVGVINGSYFIAAAAGAVLFGRWMDRTGRRPGLAASYLLLATAGGVCAFAIAQGWFLLLLAGTVLFGFAFGGSNLARGAVADMYEPSQRGRAVGIVLAVGTIGAVGSPFLIAFLRGWAGREAIDADVLPWIVVPVTAIAAFACALSLRPDPRDLAVRVEVVANTGARTPRQLLRIGQFRTAVIAAAVGQMAMVAVMGVTPVALHHHHTSATVVSTVISLHIAGMWVFSPVIGAALDRFGRRPGLIAGGATSVVGAVRGNRRRPRSRCRRSVRDRARLVGDVPRRDRRDQRSDRAERTRGRARLHRPARQLELRGRGSRRRVRVRGRGVPHPRPRRRKRRVARRARRRSSA
jgi:MFS family permease